MIKIILALILLALVVAHNIDRERSAVEEEGEAWPDDPIYKDGWVDVDTDSTWEE